MLGLQTAVIGLHSMVTHLQYPRLLVDLKPLCNTVKETQRMEDGLIFKAHSQLDLKRQLAFAFQSDSKAQLVGRFGFTLQQIGPHPCIKPCRLVLQAAVNALVLDDPLVMADGPPVHIGILPCPCHAEILDQPVIDQPVLGRDLGRGAAGLPAAHTVGLQQNDLSAPPVEKIGDQHPGHTAADDDILHLSPGQRPTAGLYAHSGHLPITLFMLHALHILVSFIQRMPISFVAYTKTAALFAELRPVFTVIVPQIAPYAD